MSKPTPQPEVEAAWQAIRPHLRLVLFMSIALGLLTLAPIGYMREVYGPVMNSRSEMSLFWFTALLVLALLMSGWLTWVRQQILLAASSRLSVRMHKRIFQATFQANLRGINGAAAALSDFRQIKQFLASPVAGFVFEAPVALLFLLLIFFIHPFMGLMSCLGAFLTVVLTVLTEKNVGPLMEQAGQYSRRSQSRIADYSRNAQAGHAMGMMPALQARWLSEQSEFLRFQAKASNAQGLGTALSKVIMMVQGSALLGVGTLLTLIGTLPPSAGAMLIVAKFLGMLAVRPIMQLVQSWKSISTAKDSYRRLIEFLEQVPPAQQGMPLPPPKGHLLVQSASIRAPGQKATIITGLDFRVAPGQCLAVMGPSGSGKSSLARLITGVWAPLVGDVRLDGVSVSGWPKEELGPFVGYLPQDLELFDGTLAENISRFAPRNDEALAQAIDDAGLAPLIQSLPDGLDTWVGADGHALSGGQRQRVGLARALYGAPKLLVLDEPNANLDATGDAALSLALQRAKARNTTIVLMTHRREILQLADLVLILAEGKQRLFGPRDQVFAQIAAARQQQQGQQRQAQLKSAAPARPSLAPGAQPPRPEAA